MKVIVGLGNPGSRYVGTRHNVGFAVIDRLAESSVSRFQDRFEGHLTELTEGAHKLLLVKPMTFMNLSGRCVRQVVDFWKVPLEDLLVICDDIHLPLGKLRLRPRGSHGGHNGLRDIQNHLGTTDFARLRIGVDAPREAGDQVDHVLGRFSRGEQAEIDDGILRAVQATIVWVHQGIQECMNRYNG